MIIQRLPTFGIPEALEEVNETLLNINLTRDIITQIIRNGGDPIFVAIHQSHIMEKLGIEITLLET